MKLRKRKEFFISDKEKDESGSSEEKSIGNSNSPSKLHRTLKNHESDNKSCQVNSEGLEFRKTKKSKKSSAKIASNPYGLTKVSVEDVKTEPEVYRKKKKHKAEHEVRGEKPNTLLALFNDSKNSSDSSDEEKNMAKMQTKSDKRRLSETSTESDQHEVEDEYLSGSEIESDKDLARTSRTFDLEEEARDLREMIAALEEDEAVPVETMRRLRRLCVTLRHTVPPQHQVETCAGSRGLTPKQKKLFEEFGPIKYGKFTPEEDDVIVNNWKSFCKMHDWDLRDVKPFLYHRHRGSPHEARFKERQKFVQFLADGLPWRTLYSVYWRFRNLYQPHLNTKYSEDEDKLIIAHMENKTAINTKNVRKFSELAKILNRTRASVWRRYRLLKKRRDPHKKVEWNLHLVKKLIKNLMQLTLSDDVSQLKDLDIPLVVWKKLEAKFKIDNRDLKTFWLTKLHMQLFCNEPVYLNDVKIKLIEYFYVMGISKWWEIQWPNVAKKFDGMTSTFLSNIFSALVHDDKFEGRQLNKILEHLYQVKKPQLQNTRKDKCLPRIVFENGNVKVLDVTASSSRKRKKATENFENKVGVKQEK